MRLKNYSESPVGGWFFDYEDKEGNKFHIVGSGLRNLISAVASHMRTNRYEVPDYLDAWIEDQICTRQPKGRCWYENKKGDYLSRVIHAVAGGADAAAASIGLKTGLQKRARGCKSCGQRRVRMNK